MERGGSSVNGNGADGAADSGGPPQSEKNPAGNTEETTLTEADTKDHPKPTSPEPPHKTDPIPEGEGVTTRLHVGRLTRNVTEEHLRLIFAVWGPLKGVEMAIDRVVELPKGYAYVEYDKREDAENAMDHMNGGQIDGNIVEVRFVQAPRKEISPIPVPPRRSEPIPTHRSDHRGRVYDSERRRSPVRHRRRSPPRRHSRSPRSAPRRRSSPYRHRNRSPPRRGYNGGYAYDNRGPSPRRRRSPYRPRRRSPSPRYRRREPGRTSPSKRSPRSSSSLSSSISKSSSMSTSASRSGSSSK